ncbi:MAG: peptide-methionine (R)-S-oxide reductase MsrB [Vicingus serpentipes]|nr:peptide-methionine (R)-S-oxide reductase MsrB [Vicingus serpentipes]
MKDWRKELSEEEYHVMREKGTERPFSGKFNAHFENGTYTCKGCGESLFSSSSKFDAGCGWPSFDQGIETGKIKEILDKSHGMIRTEIVCANCESHLGHVFNDGPTKTRLRYCVNSISLDFKKKNE